MLTRHIEHPIELEDPGAELSLLAFLGEPVFPREARSWLLKVCEIELAPGRARLRGRLVAPRNGLSEIAVMLNV